VFLSPPFALYIQVSSAPRVSHIAIYRKSLEFQLERAAAIYKAKSAIVMKHSTLLKGQI
jgi:hypothetical protein